MSGDPYIKENERLEAEIARSRLNYKEMCDCAETWEAETERLRAENAKLRAALEEIVSGRLHSIDLIQEYARKVLDADLPTAEDVRGIIPLAKEGK